MAMLSVEHVTRRFGGIVAVDDVSFDVSEGEIVGLAGLAHDQAAELPYGTQKRVKLARALASGPRLLLLDEPAGGLNHEEVAELGSLIRTLRDDFDLTLLLVEHHMGLVMSIADR